MINNYNDITNFEYLIDLLSEEHISKITEKYKGDETQNHFLQRIILDYLCLPKRKQ